MMKTRAKWLFVAATLGLGLVVGTALTTDTLSREVQAQRPEQFLMYSAQNSTNWVTETVDSDGDAGTHGQRSSLALDGTGTPHVAYHVASGDSLRFAVLSGTIWISETLEESAGGPSLVLDGSGSPHIAYTHRGPIVNYAVLSGTTWVTETVDDQDVAHASLALDSCGNPHIAYGDIRGQPPAWGQDIKYAYWTGSQWVIRSVEDIAWERAPSIALDSSDTPHVAYNAATDDSLRYAVWSGTTWITQTVEVSALFPSLVLDSSDNPHIAYTHRGPYVNYAVWNGTTWVVETVDAEPVASPSLALDSFGNPHIAYCDVRPLPPQAPGEGLKYAYRTASGWVVERVDAVQCQDPSLALDGSDNPRISYYDATSDDLKYAHWVASHATESITTGGGSLSSSEDRTTYTFPQDVFTDTVVVTHTPRFPGSVPPSENLTGIGHAFDVTAVYSSTGGSAQPAPGETYTITVQYTDNERGLIDENTLALYYWDGNQWVEEPSSVPDPPNNTVTATPNHFSLWAVLGEVRKVFLPLILGNY